MKKVFSVLSVLVIFMLLVIPSLSVQGLQAGDDYYFNVKRAKGSFNYTNGGTTTSGNTSSFRVGTHSIPVNAQIRAHVNSISSGDVSYSIYDSSNAKLTDVTSNGFNFALGLIYYSFFPFIVMGISSGTVNPIDPTIGVSLSDNFYFAPPSTDWNNVYDYYNDSTNWEDLYNSFDTAESNVTGSSYAKWYDAGETISFLVSVMGRYIISSESTDLIIIHTLRFDYNVTSYTLQGYNLQTTISGTYKGEDTTFSMSVQIAEENYTRPLGLSWIYLGVGIITTFTIMILVKKKVKAI